MGTVPNSSERFGTVPKPTGRNPVMTDEELATLAEKLNTQKGRPPSVQDLIDATGGCQRQRAVRTVQALRLKLAERAVHSQLVFTQEMEAEVKLLMARWLGLASSQLAQRQAQADELAQARLQAASETAEDQADRIRHLTARLTDVEHLNQELVAGNRELNEDLSRTRIQLQTQTALATERQRLLDNLLSAVPATGVSS